MNTGLARTGQKSTTKSKRVRPIFLVRRWLYVGLVDNRGRVSLTPQGIPRVVQVRFAQLMWVSADSWAGLWRDVIPRLLWPPWPQFWVPMSGFSDLIPGREVEVVQAAVIPLEDTQEWLMKSLRSGLNRVAQTATEAASALADSLQRSARWMLGKKGMPKP